jgi:aminopeptidase YwaD
VARTLRRLITKGALPRPKRTIRFIWGPEHEGTMAYLATHPEIKQQMRADVHMDMVGGDPFKNKSILHVTETPWSLPSFVTDVGAVFLDKIRDGASQYAGSGTFPEDALLENSGTRNEFLADITPFEAGSDHDDYDSSTIGIPSLYLRDWPDIYIHTDHDSLEQIDPTKLRRVAALGAAAGFVYANLDAQDLPKLIPFLTARSQQRLAQTFIRAQTLEGYEAHNLMTHSTQRELAAIHSAVIYCGGPSDSDAEAIRAITSQISSYKLPGGQPQSSPLSAKVPVRVADFGPVENQYDDALLARLGPTRYSQIKLGGLYAYEVLNYVNGKRTVGEIRDAVAAEYGPVAIELVSDYLNALAEAKIISYREAM